MKNRKGRRRMATVAKVLNFTEKTQKNIFKLQKELKTSKPMSRDSIKSSYDFKKRSWERD